MPPREEKRLKLRCSFERFKLDETHPPLLIVYSSCKARILMVVLALIKLEPKIS